MRAQRGEIQTDFAFVFCVLPALASMIIIEKGSGAWYAHSATVLLRSAQFLREHAVDLRGLEQLAEPPTAKDKTAIFLARDAVEAALPSVRTPLPISGRPVVEVKIISAK